MNYAVSEFKPMDSPRRLSELEEARGQLLRVFEAEGQCVAVFSWGACSLPGDMIERLRELVGRKCAVLRLDERYHVRGVA